MTLVLNDVALRLDGKPLLGPLSLTIKAGEIVTLMGPSGSGKSSLLSLIAGDVQPPLSGQGTMTIGGRNLGGIPPARRNIGRLFQDDLLFPHMTVAENVLFGIPRGPKTERLAAMRQGLHDVELDGFENRAPHTLSGGQRSRVALMRALLARPDAMLLDEPFNKLDQALRSTIRTLTFNHLAAGAIPTLLVTHDSQDAPAGGRIYTINTKGEITHV